MEIVLYIVLIVVLIIVLFVALPFYLAQRSQVLSEQYQEMLLLYQSLLDKKEELQLQLDEERQLRTFLVQLVERICQKSDPSKRMEQAARQRIDDRLDQMQQRRQDRVRRKLFHP